MSIILLQVYVHSPIIYRIVQDKTTRIYDTVNEPTPTFQNKLSFLFEIPGKKETQGRFWLRWEYNIEIYLLETEWEITK
jgi:hypothetical protein